MMAKIIKGDTVEVLTGKDRGKQGRVVHVWPKEAKVLIEGVNQVKRHEKVRPAQGRSGVEGGIIVKELPIHISKVGVVCGSCDKPTRVGFDEGRDGKVRVCRKCGGKI
ncbi:MAG: 50S ribosomal protein L24 [Actinomycetota bacterium]